MLFLSPISGIKALKDDSIAYWIQHAVAMLAPCDFLFKCSMYKYIYLLTYLLAMSQERWWSHYLALRLQRSIPPVTVTVFLSWRQHCHGEPRTLLWQYTQVGCPSCVAQPAASKHWRHNSHLHAPFLMAVFRVSVGTSWLSFPHLFLACSSSSTGRRLPVANNIN